MKYLNADVQNKISEIHKSVQSVIQTIYDIVEVHGGEIRVEALSAEAGAQAGKEGEGSDFIIKLPIA